MAVRKKVEVGQRTIVEKRVLKHDVPHDNDPVANFFACCKIAPTMHVRQHARGRLSSAFICEEAYASRVSTPKED